MTIRIGLIGCGEYCSKTHAAILHKMDNVQIVAISECKYPGEIEKRQKQFDIPNRFTSYLEMLDSIELDAAIISTPHANHFEQVKNSLEKNLHVLVDKPLCCNFMEAQILVSLASLRNRHLIVASQKRYDSTLREIRDIVNRKDLGELRFVRYYYGRSKHQNFITSWRNDPNISGGGVLIDAGYHIIDTLLWIIGCEPREIRGEFAHFDTNVETIVSLTLDLGRNALANVAIHLEMPYCHVQEELDIVGSKGVIQYHYSKILKNKPPIAQVTKIIGRHKTAEEIIKVDNDLEPAKNLINAICGDKPVLSSGRDSLLTIKVIEQVYNEINPRSNE